MAGVFSVAVPVTVLLLGLILCIVPAQGANASAKCYRIDPSDGILLNAALQFPGNLSSAVYPPLPQTPNDGEFYWEGPVCSDGPGGPVISIDYQCTGGGDQWNLTLEDLLNQLQHLQELKISNCNVTGTLPLTTIRLRSVVLSKTALSGKFPDYWQPGVPLPEILQHLDLTGNQLTGILPSDDSNTSDPVLPSSLRSLILSQNMFEGTIPSAWIDSWELTYLDLSNNKFTGTQFATVNLSRCPFSEQACALNSSMISGGNNHVLASRPLTYLNLSHNLLSGVVPSTWIAAGNLQTLDLSGNNFSGPVPRVWQGLDKLRTMFLSQDVLTSTAIPSMTLEGLPNLGVLKLDQNLFQGQIFPSVWAAWPPAEISIAGNMFSPDELPEVWREDGEAAATALKLHLNSVKQSSTRFKADYSWRQLCRRKVYTTVTWCVGSDRECNPPTGLTTLGAGDTSFNTDRRSNVCIYPRSKEVLVFGAALTVFSVFCMAITVLTYRDCCVERGQERDQPCPFTRVLCFLFALAKPMMCVVDVVTDSLTIAQYWPAWQAYALLVTVFIPDLIVSAAVTMSMVYRLTGYQRGGMSSDTSAAHGIELPYATSAAPTSIGDISTTQSQSTPAAISFWRKGVRGINVMAQWGRNSLQVYEMALSRCYRCLGCRLSNAPKYVKLAVGTVFFLCVWVVNVLLVPCWLVIGAMCKHGTHDEAGAAISQTYRGAGWYEGYSEDV